MISTSRNTIYRLIPKWARGFHLFTVLYAIALVTDALWDMLVNGIKIGFAGLYSNESIPRIAAERKMFQGRAESPESFAARLSTWWDVAKRSGCFYMMAKELAAYFLPGTIVIEIVTNNGTRHTLGTDGSWVIDSTAWRWTSNTAEWSRFAVLISNADLGVTSTDHLVSTVSAKVLQPGRFIGSDATADAAALRTIMETHRAPHTFCDSIIVVLDHANFWANAPDGTWLHWKNRNNFALYWAGTINA